MALGTTNEQRALRAFLAARTPAAGQLGLTPGAAMLSTPHLQGLLQQLRISTPSLGPQVSCKCGGPPLLTWSPQYDT